jgi:hypothetical protein
MSFAIEEGIKHKLENLYIGLAGTIAGAHFVSLIAIVMAVMYAMRINFHFTHQEKIMDLELMRRVS